MKANELQINNFLQTPTVQFVIPVYQRNYDWTTYQCGDLLRDIISVEQDNRGTHFIGSIVFIHEGAYSTSEVKELVIIDGQQRLLTITILMAVLRDAMKSLDQEKSKLYQRKAISIENWKGGEAYRIIPSDTLKDYFIQNIQILIALLRTVY